MILRETLNRWYQAITLCGLITQSAATAQEVVAPRYATVEDAIEMTRIVSVPQFSPDQKRFAVLLQRGNLQKNVTQYDLVVFRTERIAEGGAPERVVRLESPANEPGISSVRWLDDETITYMGRRSPDDAQVYSVNVRTKAITQLTHHPTTVVAYDLSRNIGPMLYVAARPRDEALRASMERRGFTVTNQFVGDIVAGNWDRIGELFQTFVRSPEAQEAMAVKEAAHTWVPFFDELSISPDGRFALTVRAVRAVPEAWQGYTDPILKKWLIPNVKSDSGDMGAFLFQYMLIDLQKGTIAPLLNAPLANVPERSHAWSPDSKAVVVSGTFQPLDVSDADDLARRKSKPAIVEVDLTTGALQKITDDHLRVARWDGATNTLTLSQRTPRVNIATGPATEDIVPYRKRSGVWSAVPEAERTPPSGSSAQPTPTIRVEQGLNTPPTLVAIDLKTNRRVTLLDPNPKFRQIRFAHVEAMTWTAKDGDEWKGGLYRPPSYVPGRRYPLVIQTHGFNDRNFEINGLYDGVAFAAQALATRDIIVLQAGFGETFGQKLGSAAEGPHVIAGIEGAIDHLDKLGLIDRSRIGIIGFSRTGWHVLYHLTHSDFPFAAATVSDNYTASYWRYLLSDSLGQQEIEENTGGRPWGNSFSTFYKNATGFQLDKVRVPLRQEAYDRRSALNAWETYAGLRRLGKPVELVVIPNGTHLLVKPWERLTIQQGNVDWFCFWLKGEEDSDHAKRGQYVRWRAMREQLKKNQSTSTR